jgi:flagellum-specific ATP synthase
MTGGSHGLAGWTHLGDQLGALPLGQAYGRVIGAAGLVVTCEGLPQAALGARCRITDVQGLAGPEVRIGEVVGHRQGQTMLMPFGGLEGIGPGARVYPEQGQPSVRVNQSWLGRVVDALGQPIDGKGPLSTLGGEDRLLKAPAPPAGQRRPLGVKIDTGVRVFNTALPLCEGQRLGIFSGSGVGKSVLMGMMAQHSQADVNVIGLIGERGREVREFLEEQLGPQGLSRSVVVVATGDEPPLMRRQAAFTTMAIAEYFRDCGFRVLMMLDSVTRFALAQREIGLASGEPPTTRGFTPSVFAELPKLLERAGPGLGKGSVSGVFTVLVEGGDMDEPVADAVRGILDGHIILTRQLAERGHFPAVDVLKSVSRTVPQCLSAEENQLVARLRRVMATYADMEELIRLGAYSKGSDPLVDEAIRLMPAIERFLQQAPNERAAMADSFKQLKTALQM